jgi:hypothetical protein
MTLALYVNSANLKARCYLLSEYYMTSKCRYSSNATVSPVNYRCLVKSFDLLYTTIIGSVIMNITHARSRSKIWLPVDQE